jgi:hypothetical protein
LRMGQRRAGESKIRQIFPSFRRSSRGRQTLSKPALD